MELLIKRFTKLSWSSIQNQSLVLREYPPKPSPIWLPHATYGLPNSSYEFPPAGACSHLRSKSTGHPGYKYHSPSLAHSSQSMDELTTQRVIIIHLLSKKNKSSRVVFPASPHTKLVFESTLKCSGRTNKHQLPQYIPISFTNSIRTSCLLPCGIISLLYNKTTVEEMFLKVLIPLNIP